MIGGRRERVATRIGGDGGQIDGHVEVDLDAPVVVAFEQAQQRGLGTRDAGPQEEGCIGSDRERPVAGRACIGLGGAQQRVTVTTAADVGVDHEQSHVRTRFALDDGDHTDVGIAANNRKLLGGEQRAGELVDAGAVGDAAATEGSDGRKGRTVKDPLLGHDPTVPGIDATSASCARARSRFCPGRVVR